MPAVASYVPFVVTETAPARWSTSRARARFATASSALCRPDRRRHDGRSGEGQRPAGDPERAGAGHGGHSGDVRRASAASGALPAAGDFPELHRRVRRPWTPIADAASGVIVAALADKGRHCRSVVGKPVLPMQTSVEIDGLFLVESIPMSNATALGLCRGLPDDAGLPAAGLQGLAHAVRPTICPGSCCSSSAAASSLWIVYGLMLEEPPIILFNAITLGLTLVLATIKLPARPAK